MTDFPQGVIVVVGLVLISIVAILLVMSVVDEMRYNKQSKSTMSREEVTRIKDEFFSGLTEAETEHVLAFWDAHFGHMPINTIFGPTQIESGHYGPIYNAFFAGARLYKRMQEND
mgnify:CR=1 FL=1